MIGLLPVRQAERYAFGTPRLKRYCTSDSGVTTFDLAMSQLP